MGRSEAGAVRGLVLRLPQIQLAAGVLRFGVFPAPLQGMVDLVCLRLAPGMADGLNEFEKGKVDDGEE